VKTINSYCKPLLVVLLLIVSGSAFSQNGSLKGTVTDDSGAPLMDVNIAVPRLEKGATTDWDGNFEIEGIPAGTYTIFINLIGYKADTLRNFVINPGAPTVLNRSLKKSGTEDVIELDIAVVGSKKTDTEEAVIEEIKQEEEVVTGFSGNTISKGPDRDASQVVRRIPGVTLIENRFVMIRGLSQRYNTVMLNNAITPSSEVDIKAFSFDILQSSVIDRLLVYKSGSPDLPGDFAGGVIKVFTKNIPDSSFVSLGISLGYRTGTTFNEFKRSERYFSDYFGFGASQRNLPDDFSENLRKTTPAENTAAGKSLPSFYNLTNSTALPDLRLNFNMGSRWEKNGKILGTITGVSYTNANQYQRIFRYRYEAYNKEMQRSDTTFRYVDASYSNGVRLGVVHNWALVAGKSRLDFKNIFTQTGIRETTIREGVVFPSGIDVRNYSFRHEARSIYSGQLNGDHDLTDNLKFSWTTGLSYTNRQEPDYRRMRTTRNMGTADTFVVVIPPGASTFDLGRFYSKLNETVYMASGNLEKFFGKSDDAKKRYAVRTGFYTERKDRDFSARWFSYTRGSQFNGAIQQLPPDQILKDENINAVTGFRLSEGTDPSDRYRASNTLLAGYLGTSLPFTEKYNLSGGLRVEHNIQDLESGRVGGQPVSVNNPVTSFLPSVSSNYSFNEKNLVRIAYSKTINRPEFRELSPFSYYDFNNDVNIRGNDSLKNCNIHNVDVRYELYPSAEELISFGLFYKRFINPVERYIEVGSSNIIYSFRNADYANSLGAELEVRKNLAFIDSSSIFRNLSVFLNASLIRSYVNLGSSTEAQASDRPMEGQSPYIVNFGLYYADDNGFQFNLLYNIYGRRIFAIGNYQNPTIYEMPRNLLDVTISKKITEKMEVRFTAQDILNARFRLIQDSDENRKINSADEPILSAKRGVYTTIGFNYKF
jgi:hypothetical protein